jgi:hypothetical protein
MSRVFHSLRRASLWERLDARVCVGPIRVTLLQQDIRAPPDACLVCHDGTVYHPKDPRLTSAD